jgi:hypothetical protein
VKMVRPARVECAISWVRSLGFARGVKRNLTPCGR